MRENSVIIAVAMEYGVSCAEMMSRAKHLPLAEARQMAMYILSEDYGFQKTHIAEIFERTHPSVCYAVNSIDFLRRTNKGVKSHYERIKNQLG